MPPTTTGCSGGGRATTYRTHRPPTVLDETGRDLRKGHWLDAATTAAIGIRLYHYSLLLPKQVIEKCDYYATADWARRTGAVEWANEAYLSLRRPFRVHNVFAYPSWLERYRGPRPPEVVAMMSNLQAGEGASQLRPTADIEHLLDSRWYAAGRRVVRSARSVGPARSAAPGRARRRDGPSRRPGSEASRPIGAAHPATAGDMTAPLRVIQVTRVAQGGGAERIASSLHHGLLGRGHESWMATARNDGSDSRILTIPPPNPRDAGLASRGLRRIARAMGPRDKANAATRAIQRALRTAAAPRHSIDRYRGRELFDFPGTAAIPDLPPMPLDVIHCHNLHGGYFDLRQLAPMSHRLPLAMTLHDEWTFTGHCGYGIRASAGARVAGAVRTSRSTRQIPRDGTRANWRAKRNIYARSRLYVSTPSQWLMDRARASILAEGAAGWRMIPNGVDRSVFRPGDRAEARERLGLPAEPFILLFVANRAQRSPYKDPATVLAAAAHAALGVGRPVLCLALGDDGPSQPIENGELRFVPYRSEIHEVADHFRAADVYLHAARAENLPTTILEALSTGIPVVATAVGGIPEEIRSLAGAPGAWHGASLGIDEATGVLVAPGDAAGMGAAAAAVLQDENLRRALSANAAADAARRFDLERQLDATIDWYREIIADWKSRERSR